jgi:hypothetical protein
VSEKEQNINVTDPEAEITTDEPAAPLQAPKSWQMPEPVFQQTSGYLPEGFEKRYPAATAVNDSAPAAPPPAPDPFLHTFVGTPGASVESFTRLEPSTPAAAAIVEQPELPDEAVVEEAPAEVVAKKERSATARVVFALLLIIGGLLLMTVFLGVVYYLFFYPNGDQGNF